MNIRTSTYSNIVAALGNLLLAYVVYMITRVAYVLENWQLFAPGWADLSWTDLLAGSLRFDSSAIFYTNAVYLALMLLPLHWKERPWWQTMCKTIFVVVNSVAMTINLVDAVYSQYTGRRTTWAFFTEFSNEGNLGSIFFVEVLNHWYLVLLGVALIALMLWLYLKPDPASLALGTRRGRARYYLVQTLAVAVMLPLSVCAMRGGASTAIRPITISNANQYVNTPSEAAIVLNTPFSLIRTSGKKAFVDPHFYTPDELDALYSPLHLPDSNALASAPLRGKNLVVIIVESFGREYIGYYNRTLDGGQYRGYTPFVDSLLSQSLTFSRTLANGRKSIDAMPSILSSIPMFEESFFLTPASLNNVSGLADCLAGKGYTTAFFHGAANGSMGFQAFARSTGFQSYFGRTEYDADSRFGGDADFDGTWAIWDEPFLQYFALTMNQLPQPFMTAVFTASSHHPYVIPDAYRDTFPEEGGQAIHKCIRYTDHALRRFFATASRQPWYQNTVFVLTADHTNQISHDLYRTSLGLFSAPILIFDPSGSLPRGMRDGVAQQIDLMPTLLPLLGYDKPFVAFGKNLLDSTDTHDWAVINSGGIYQYVDGDHLLLFDGQQSTALYNLADDPLQRNNLLGADPDREQRMTAAVKAVIQSYMVRMTTNTLVP